MEGKNNQHDIPLITIEKHIDDSDDDEEEEDDEIGDGDTRQRLLRSSRREQTDQEEPEVEGEGHILDEVIVRAPPTPRNPPTPAPRTSLGALRASVPLLFEDPSESTSFGGVSEPPLPPREPTAAARLGSAGLVSPHIPPRPSTASTSTSSSSPSAFRSALPSTPSKPKEQVETYTDHPLSAPPSSSLPKPRTSSSSLSAASSLSPSPLPLDIPPPPRLFFSSRNASTSSADSAPPLPPKKHQPPPSSTARYKTHAATAAAAGMSKPPLPSTSGVATAAARARRVPPTITTTTAAAAQVLRAVPPAPERDSVTVFPLLCDTSSLYEPILRRKASDKDEYLDTNDLKALVHTELPSTRRRKTVVTEKTYAETGPYYLLTKAAAATFGWLSSSRDDYDITRSQADDEPDPQDALRVVDLAETILHKDGVFAPPSSEPADTPGSETSGGSRTSSQRTFSDRMRRMTCTYEPNTNLHTRVVVRRASTRRDTALDIYSAPKSNLSTQRLSKPGPYVRPYAVASVLGLKDRSPSPLMVSDIGSGQDLIESGGSDVERGEFGGFMGPAAYDPVSPDATDFIDKTQVMLLR